MVGVYGLAEKLMALRESVHASAVLTLHAMWPYRYLSRNSPNAFPWKDLVIC